MQANKMRYLRSLVQIPSLDPDPPSFLLLGQLIELELAKKIKLASYNREEESITTFGTLIEPGEVERSVSRQPEPAPVPRPSPPKQRVVQPKPPPATTSVPTSVFDTQFSSVSSSQQFNFPPAAPSVPKRDERLVVLFVCLLLLLFCRFLCSL